MTSCPPSRRQWPACNWLEFDCNLTAIWLSWRGRAHVSGIWHSGLQSVLQSNNSSTKSKLFANNRVKSGRVIEAALTLLRFKGRFAKEFWRVELRRQHFHQNCCLDAGHWNSSLILYRRVPAHVPETEDCFLSRVGKRCARLSTSKVAKLRI